MIISRLFRFSTQHQVIVKGSSFQVGVKYNLPVLKQATAPVLQRKQLTQAELWSQRPFQGDLLLPIFKLTDAQYTGESVKLEHLELIITTRLTPSFGDVHEKFIQTDNEQNIDFGSSISIRVQECQDKVDKMQTILGQRQKPGWNKGVKAHGRKARSLRLEMPKKVRLQGLKVGLTAALYDKRIRIIDNESIVQGRTKELLKTIHSFVEDDTVLIITGYKVDPSFERASKNLQQISLCQPDRVNIIKLMTSKWILITKDGLEQLTQHLIDRTVNCYTRGKVALPGAEEKKRVQLFMQYQILGLQVKEEPKVSYDPTKPLDLKFKILKEYMSEYEKLKQDGKLDKFIQDMPKTRRNKGLLNSVDE